jgi:predicted short-subunit dehydrogenase-like oxidoreductase (DUF2520 family)
MRVALVGAGNVGTAVAHLLIRREHELVAIASRSADSSLRATKRLEADVYEIEELPPADLVLIGASDAAIGNVAERIAPRVEPGAYVCHFAGSFGPSILRAVTDRGASACAIHPVQACPTVDAAIARLPGSGWGVTCSDPGAEDVMVELIDQDLAGFSVVLPEALRPVWHAAAVMTSNGIAALLAVGESLLAEVGVDDPARVLGPLAAGAVENAREGGGGAATLTGPVARGDKETIRRHLEALVERTPVHDERYRAVASLIVRVARDAGRIDAAAAAEMIEEFGL